MAASVAAGKALKRVIQHVHMALLLVFGPDLLQDMSTAADNVAATAATAAILLEVKVCCCSWHGMAHARLAVGCV